MIQTIFNLVRKFAVIFASCLTMQACLFTEAEIQSIPSKSSQIEVKAGHYDTSELTDVGYPHPKILKIPGAVLNVKAINRPSTPLRDGPGTQFPISHQLLQWGMTVIEIESYQVWRKIVVTDDLRTGWVHHKTLTTQISGARKNAYFKIPGDKLPLRHSKVSSADLYSFPDNKKIEVKIPEDTPLIQLRKQKDQTLILLNERGNVAWISTKYLY